MNFAHFLCLQSWLKTPDIVVQRVYVWFIPLESFLPPSLLPFIEKSSLLTKVEKIWIQYTCFKHNASRKRFGSAMYEHSREIVFESYRLMRVWIGNFTYGITNLVGKPPFFCRIKNHVYSWCLLLLIVRQLMHKKANLCIYI